MKNFYVLFFTVLMVNCQQNENESFEMLYHSDVTDDLFIGRGGNMVYLNNNQIVGMDNVAQTCFYLLNTDSDNYSLCNFGNKGQGPKEFITPFSLQYINESTVGCYDVTLKRFYELSISQNCPQFDILSTTTFLFDWNFKVIKTAYNNILGIGPYENEMFILFDSDGEKINSFFEFPYKDTDEKRMNKNKGRAMAYQGNISANPNKTKFIYAAFSCDIIHFYEIKENEIILIRKIENSYPEYLVEEKGGGIGAAVKTTNKRGYIDTYTTDKYIYLLYSGKSFSEHQDKAFETDILRIYDWDGNLQKNIKLDISM